MPGFWEQATATFPGAYQQAGTQYLIGERQRQEQERLEKQARLRATLERAKERLKAAEARRKEHEKVMAEHKKAQELFMQQANALKLASASLKPYLKKGLLSEDDFQLYMNDIEANPQHAGSYVRSISEHIRQAQKPKEEKPTEAETKRIIIKAYGDKPMDQVPLEYRDIIADYHMKTYPSQTFITPAGPMSGEQLDEYTRTVRAETAKRQEREELEKTAKLTYEQAIIDADPTVLDMKKKGEFIPYESWRLLPSTQLKFGAPPATPKAQPAQQPQAQPSERQATQEQEAMISELERQLQALENSLK